MNLFTVSCAQWGETKNKVFTTIVDTLPLRDALRLIPTLPCVSAAFTCAAPSDSVPEHVRLISFHYGPSARAGDYWEVSLHFPPGLSPATRGRLVRLLTP